MLVELVVRAGDLDVETLLGARGDAEGEDPGAQGGEGGGGRRGRGGGGGGGRGGAWGDGGEGKKREREKIDGFSCEMGWKWGLGSKLNFYLSLFWVLSV